MCIIFSRPESRKTASAGRFESCGWHRRKVAAVKRSCKLAATPRGFPTSTQPQLDNPDLTCSTSYSTTKQTHGTHNCGSWRTSSLPVSAVLPSRFSKPYQRLIETSPVHRAHGRYLAHAGHTITRFESQILRDFGVVGV
jgi:hypothetical protein